MFTSPASGLNVGTTDVLTVAWDAVVGADGYDITLARCTSLGLGNEVVAQLQDRGIAIESAGSSISERQLDELTTDVANGFTFEVVDVTAQFFGCRGATEIDNRTVSANQDRSTTFPLASYGLASGTSVRITIVANADGVDGQPSSRTISVN